MTVLYAWGKAWDAGRCMYLVAFFGNASMLYASAFGKGIMTGLMFQDRSHAGRNLAAVIARFDLHDPVVVSLPCGGVPVAIEIASALDAPLQALAVRKLRAPTGRKVTIGAVAGDNITVLNDDLVPDLAGIEGRELDELVSAAHDELIGLSAQYGGDGASASMQDRDVLVIDDGMTSGGSMRAAVELLRRQHPARILVAVPTTSKYAEQRLLGVADDVICLDMPEAFLAVGCYYLNFGPVSHADASRQLAAYSRSVSARSSGFDASTAILP